MNKNFFEKNKELASLTTFKIGGRADFFCQPENTKEIFFALNWAKENSLPVFILGGGSNVLISDNGFKGLVINPKNIFLKKLKEEKEKIYFEVGGGYFLSSLLKEMTKNSLTGLEWAAGIPGTIAGAISGNAGAYGNSMSDSIEEVKFIDLKEIKEKKFNKHQCQFNYRSSIFDNSVIITSAILSFRKGNSDLIKEQIKEILLKRINKIPVEPTAGCIFKNIKEEKLSKEILKKIPSEIIIKKKIPVAWLIEQCKLKGKEIGGAKISQVHSNFIVNYNKAKAKDVLKLIDVCKRKVKEKFNIVLEEEIKLIGF